LNKKLGFQQGSWWPNDCPFERVLNNVLGANGAQHKGQ